MGLDTTAIETCIVGWADETQDGAEIPAARAELAALVEAAGRAAVLAPAVALPDIDRALACLGVATTPTSMPDDERYAAAETVRTFLRVLRTVVAVVGAGPGAAGARDETLALEAVAREAAAWRATSDRYLSSLSGAWRLEGGHVDPDWLSRAADIKTEADAILARLYAALDALDALRARGAGGEEAADGD